MWTMIKGHPINILVFLTNHFENVAKASKRATLIEGLIAPITEYVGYKIVIEELNKILESTWMDMEACITMKSFI